MFLKRRFLIAVLLLLGLLSISCNLLAIAEAGVSQGNGVQVTVIPPESTSAPDSLTQPTAYPTTPEDVVGEFLVSSQENPALMVQYLTSEAQQNLPAEGPLALLGLDAPIEGHMIRSASISPDPPAAMVNVDLLAGGEELSRRFTLRQVNGFWFIDQIDGLR